MVFQAAKFDVPEKRTYSLRRRSDTKYWSAFRVQNCGKRVYYTWQFWLRQTFHATFADIKTHDFLIFSLLTILRISRTLVSQLAFLYDIIRSVLA